MELNHTRSEMMTHRRRNASKWVYREDLVTDEGLEAMKSGIINDLIPVKGMHPLESIIQQIVPQPLSSDAYNQDAIIRNDINEVTGVNEYLRGAPQDISRTATEASIIEGATNVRTRHKLNQVETFLRRIGQHLLDTITNTLPETDYEEMRMYVTGSEAQRLNATMGNENINTDVLLTPSPEIFVGEYLVDVERGSVELRNPQAQAAKFKEMFQILMSAAPLLMQQGLQINLRQVLEMWFEASNIEDVDSMFVTNDPQLAMMQQQEQMMQEQAIAGGQVTGSRTPAGQPREATTRPPDAAPDATNSGMLPSAAY